MLIQISDIRLYQKRSGEEHRFYGTAIQFAIMIQTHSISKP